MLKKSRVIGKFLTSSATAFIIRILLGSSSSFIMDYFLFFLL